MRSKKRKAWTSEEARRFLESAREAGDPLYAAFVLILVLGFRKGEVLGLAWDEVDLDNRRLMIEWQVQRVGRELLRRQTKTEASDAGLPLPEICITALRERQIRQGEQRAAAGRGWEAVENLVFTRDCGSPVEPRTFNRQFSARCRKAGVKTITVHDARRTCDLAGRLGRPPANRDGDPSPRPDRGDDGDLRAGLVARDAGGSEEAGRAAEQSEPGARD
jgi:integrase